MVNVLVCTCVLYGHGYRMLCNVWVVSADSVIPLVLNSMYMCL